MEAVMAVSPERTAELVALLEKALGLSPRPRPKPKAVVDDGEVVRDADVRVGPADPNYRESDEGWSKLEGTSSSGSTWKCGRLSNDRSGRIAD
jgi:hypothetical protein